MPSFIANSHYEEKDQRPIELKSGDLVTLGQDDHTWPGWVWATNNIGQTGYIPKAIIAPSESSPHRLLEDFNPTVLTIHKGDQLVSLKQVHGWHWCRNEDGHEGWVAGYLLRPIS